MNLIAAVDSQWGIGFQNQLLNSIPSDMKQFQERTTGHLVIMGRRTLESFPNGLPLTDRKNIVLTKDRSYRKKGAIICHSMEEVLHKISSVPKNRIFVIGGESIYRQFLPYCDTAYITYMDYRYQADRYMENLDQNPDWILAEESEEQTYFDLEYVYRIYKKKKTK